MAPKPKSANPPILSVGIVSCAGIEPESAIAGTAAANSKAAARMDPERRIRGMLLT